MCDILFYPADGGKAAIIRIIFQSFFDARIIAP